MAHCRGLCFDPEPYGDNPWHYSSQKHAKEKTFAEYQAKVRQRGAEFLNAITAHLPKAVIHTFYQASMFDDLADEPDLVKRERLLSQRDYGLYPAFINLSP